MAKPISSKKGGYHTPNPLEALKEIAVQTTQVLQHEVFRAPETKKKVSGDLRAGESVSFNEVKQAQKQIVFERYLLEEEKSTLAEKTNNLRLELQAIMQEVQYLAKATANLGAEVKTATFQAPANPGKYHIVFFETVLETIKSFRKKIESASVWLAGVNKRTQKKGFWGQYKQQKSSFLLNPESYNARSTG